MTILAIDSTTEACSVALIEGCTVASHFELAPREHSQRLLPMVDQLLQQQQVSLNELDAIAFGRGPGSFTGLRICVGLVQGLAFGADLPVIPVSSLAALAQTAIDDELCALDATVAAAIDARMDEIYWQCFTVVDGLVVPVEATLQEQLTTPEQLFLPVQSSNSAATVAVGSGWQYAQRLPEQPLTIVDDQLLPKASAIARLAQREWENGVRVPADQAMPSYVRNEVAWKKIHEQ